MKKILLSLLLVLGLHAGASAAEEGYPWDRFPTEKLTDMAALQTGAKVFVNYCLNCHSAAYMRYNRLRDIGLSEDQIKKNLLFTTTKVGETMKTSLDAEDAKAWFGTTPPDLSLIARSRAEPGKGSGADYLYTYLRTFYRDDTRPTGWNNLVFPDVAMPHALWELQGERAAHFVDEKNPHDPEGKPERRFEGFEQLTKGTETPLQYDQTVADLVAYLQWMGEPSQGQRVRIGVWVLLFIGLLTVFVWRLDASYWRTLK